MSLFRLISLITFTAPLMLLVGCEYDDNSSGIEAPNGDNSANVTKPITKTSKLKPKNGSTTIRPLSADSPEMVYDEYMEVYPEADTNVYDNARQIKISVF